MDVSALYLGGQMLTPMSILRQPDLPRLYRRFFEDALLCNNLKEKVIEVTNRQLLRVFF
jgi:hypothetical protein